MQALQKKAWRDRRFLPITDDLLYPYIIERLRGTTVRIYEKLSEVPEGKLLERMKEDQLSIQEIILHLANIESLWFLQAKQILAEEKVLQSDESFSNPAADHTWKEANIYNIIMSFKENRERLMNVLSHARVNDIGKKSFHPKLQYEMRFIDLAHFVAEHDDYYLTEITELTANFRVVNDRCNIPQYF